MPFTTVYPVCDPPVQTPDAHCLPVQHGSPAGKIPLGKQVLKFYKNLKFRDFSYAFQFLSH